MIFGRFASELRPTVRKTTNILLESFHHKILLRHSRLYHLSLKMETEKTDHLTRTSNNSRDVDIHRLTVTSLRLLSPTVKEIVMKSVNCPPQFRFNAGQWIDLFIPGVKTVGGFSITSSPQELFDRAQLRLAVKYSTHPPALWVHEKCQVNDKLDIRVGGDFYLTPEMISDQTKILLVAGGVGINPLSSILNYIHKGKREGLFTKHLKVCLLFSAKVHAELLFKDTIDSHQTCDPDFRVQYFITGTGSMSDTQNHDEIQYRRIEIQDLLTAVHWLTKPDANTTASVEAFVCGPPPMIKSINKNLAILKISKIHCEQWW